ncbi:hypothetical protein DFH09DRAFT_1497928 [Mycena vulgaris]|nr:hypothetical protein DFH09DRAFT_1497928 [Mycena vulgaris]
MDQAKISDDNLANILNSDLDPLLIFAGLFSAEIRKGLQEDLQSITNSLLTILIQNQHNISVPLTPTPSHSEPSSSSRWVNGLWFSSLMFSLMSTLGASLAKGWVTQFSAAVSGSTWGDAAVHCSRFTGIRRWNLTVIVQSLPILIHVAFFLFGVGLVVLVLQDDLAIGTVISVLTTLVALLYIGSSLHPAFSLDSPFRTPVSGMIRSVSSGSWRREDLVTFPSRQDAQKAHTLAWLLTESPDVDTINSAIQAIAGLPANHGVQDELLRSSTVLILCRTLATEFIRLPLDRDAMSTSLYAIFHLVRATQGDAHDGISQSLRALLDPSGALSITDTMPPGIREIALCVKGRIFLFYLPASTHDNTLFDTDIPVLAKSCTDRYLRRLLVEICLLTRAPAKAAVRASSYRFLATLSDRDVPGRNEVHM